MKLTSNIQAPEKFQASNTKAVVGCEVLEIDVWRFSGAWSLELGACFRRAEKFAADHFHRRGRQVDL